jgi:DNA end-binding protein Ku
MRDRHEREHDSPHACVAGSPVDGSRLWHGIAQNTDRKLPEFGNIIPSPYPLLLERDGRIRTAFEARGDHPGEGGTMASVVWQGLITFGLVSFPVRLATAARPQNVRFHLLHRKDRSRIKEVLYCVREDKPIDRADVVKGYEVEKGKYVVVEDEDLKKIAPATATSMEIIQFVGNDEVDPIFFETSYYVASEDKSAKAYVLFLAVLEETGQSAIAKLAMHNKEHIVLLRPYKEGLILHTLYYAEELQPANQEETPEANYSPKKLQLAKSLVEQLAAPFAPEDFHDAFRENVERLIVEKQSGGKVSVMPAPRKAPVIDLMETLQRSLKEGKTRKSPRKATGSKTTRSRSKKAS